MNEITIHNPDIREEQDSAQVLIKQAHEVTIADADDREQAGEFVSAISEKIKLIELKFNGTDDEPGPTALIHKAWKASVKLRDDTLAPFKDIKTTILKKVQNWEYQVEQIRLAEVRKNEEKARAKAELERKAQIAEAKRIGDLEAAQQLKQAPLAVTVAPPKTEAVQKADGLRRSSPVWRYTVTDPNKIPDQYWMLNEVALNAAVRSQGSMTSIPGISVYDERSVK